MAVLWFLISILFPVAKVTPSTSWPFAYAEAKAPLSVVATLTACCAFIPDVIASTSDFKASVPVLPVGTGSVKVLLAERVLLVCSWV